MFLKLPTLTFKKQLALPARVKKLICLLPFLSFFSYSSSVQSNVYEYPLAPKEGQNKHMNINLLGSLGLTSSRFNNLPITEISGIAWDKDENIMYAVSDEGLLYHFKLTTKNNRLTNLKVTYASRLKNKNDEHLRGKYSDSEGLSLINGDNGKKGDSELIISFENKPRIARYTPRGKFLGKINLPRKLTKRKYFRHKNKGLESVTYHPVYGTLTAAEFPLKNDSIKNQTIYSSSRKKWHFPASKTKGSAITGLETLPNGDILILERAYTSPFVPIEINLSQLQLSKCNDKSECQKQKIASFSGADGWYLDNFEGLSHFNENQYLMVSDDNNNPLQNTVLVLFEILNTQPK